MIAKKKAPTARDGGALDDARLCKGDASSNAGSRLPTQDIKPFGSKLSTGARVAPFSCPVDAHFCTQRLDVADQREVVEDTKKKGFPRTAPVDPRTSLVIRPSSIQVPRRTASPQGLTIAELRRVAGAARFLSERKWKMLHGTVAGHSLDASAFDAMLRRFKSRIGDAQRRGRMRSGMYVEVRETSRSTHSHFIIAGTPAALRAIRRLEGAFGLDVDGNAFVKVTTVYDVGGLVAYLSKEASGWACQVTGRKYQRHASRAIGDRVRLGRGLEEAMIAGGELQPHKRTYATPTAAKVAKRRSVSKTSSPACDDANNQASEGRAEGDDLRRRVEVSDRIKSRGKDVQRKSVQCREVIRPITVKQVLHYCVLISNAVRASKFRQSGEERCRVHRHAPYWPRASCRRRLAGSLIRSPRRRTAPALSRHRTHADVRHRPPRYDRGRCGASRDGCERGRQSAMTLCLHLEPRSGGQFSRQTDAAC